MYAVSEMYIVSHDFANINIGIKISSNTGFLSLILSMCDYVNSICSVSFSPQINFGHPSDSLQNTF
jgi:hypothetical protein